MSCSCRKKTSIKAAVKTRARKASKVHRVSEVLRTPVHERLTNPRNPNGEINDNKR